MNNTNCRCHGTGLRVRACTPKNRDEGQQSQRWKEKTADWGRERETERKREKHKERDATNVGVQVSKLLARSTCGGVGGSQGLQRCE